jgi:hypothetical protein
MRKVRWKKEWQREGKEKIWEKWDVNLTNPRALRKQNVPEIRFARAVLEST